MYLNIYKTYMFDKFLFIGCKSHVLRFASFFISIYVLNETFLKWKPVGPCMIGLDPVHGIFCLILSLSCEDDLVIMHTIMINVVSHK